MLAVDIGIWLVLFVFVLVLWRKSKRTADDVEALEKLTEDRRRGLER